jgi:hypothetical protein
MNDNVNTEPERIQFMPRLKTMAAILTAGIFYAAVAGQFILTSFPATLVTPNQIVTIKWAGEPDPFNPLFPDSAVLYYSASPGGSDPDNYTDSVSIYYTDTVYLPNGQTDPTPHDNIEEEGSPYQRSISFLPQDQNGLTGGVYYFIAANKKRNHASNEVKVIVEVGKAAVAKTPGIGAVITSLTPEFEWENNPGVPYYHIIVSDEEISANFDSQTVEGLSIIWQAITSNTKIVYGAPDPSGTLTADPPPLSPGAGYSWLVLNNYGNHPAYTSRRFGLPRNFSLDGVPMEKPVNIWPPDGDTLRYETDRRFKLKWTGLDSNANTFKIYVYAAAEMAGVDAGVVEWETEVTAGQFTNDTGEVELDAANILTNGYYTWKVIAVDKNGAGSVGEQSGFRYAGVPAGTMKIHTCEIIEAGGYSVRQAVSGAKIEILVLGGSMEAPPMFYTGTSGNLERSRPEGTYRVTAIKDGFLESEQTISITEGATSNDTFYLERPAATIYGKITDNDGIPIDLASIYAVSEMGDTTVGTSHVSGNFVLNCSEADWRVWAVKNGYAPSVTTELSVSDGQSAGAGTIELEKYAYTLSGIVKNESGTAVTGVRVQLLSGETVIGETPSTPQDGSYSFSVDGGVYTLMATKTGFSSAVEKNFNVLSSTQKNLVISSGAALIKGVVYGETWSSSGKIYAPITGASILCVDTSITPYDSILTVSDNVFGDFRLSVAPDRQYILHYYANGYGSETRPESVTAGNGVTIEISDTLAAAAFLHGSVRAASDLSPVKGITVSLIDNSTWEAVAQTKTDAAGVWEIRDIPDGQWQVAGGMEMYMFDEVILIDTSEAMFSDTIIEISDGRAFRTVNTARRILASVDIRVVQGTKTLNWTVKHKSSVLSDASIKVRSPLQASVGANDSLNLVGPGHYVIAADAASDTVIDLSRRVLTVTPASPAIVKDTVVLPLSHHYADTMNLVSGTLPIILKSNGVVMDTAIIYYRVEPENSFDSAGWVSSGVVQGVQTCMFSITPGSNGSRMIYYFKAVKGQDVYGYSEESFSTFIKADTSVLTKIELSPFSSDTMVFAADASIKVAFNAYYGSKYLPYKGLEDSWITWQLINPAGCGLNGRTRQTDNGTVVELRTPSSGTGSAVATLIARIDTQKKAVVANQPDSLFFHFRATSSKLDSISVRRADQDERAYITTSPSDNAEFLAQGFDEQKTSVTITPDWSLDPEDAGSISSFGQYNASPKFAGHVRITAVVGALSGEFNVKSGKNVNETGLAVHYMIPLESDSVFNGKGCSVVLPEGLTGGKTGGELMISIPNLLNRNEFEADSASIIGNPVDIDEVTGLSLQTGTDSIVLNLQIPEEYLDEAASGVSNFTAACWSEDSLEWEPVPGSGFNSDATAVTAKLAHFSRYGILYSSGSGGISWKITPNPFSPYICPVSEFGHDAVSVRAMGTCFEIISKRKCKDIRIEIYNAVGDKILVTEPFPNPAVNKPYFWWWNGKGRASGECVVESILSDRNWWRIEGEKMCRNGRYFAVLIQTDMKNTEHRSKKQIVIFK